MFKPAVSVGAGSTYQSFGSCRDICWSFALTDRSDEGEWISVASRLSLHSGLVFKGATMVLISFTNKLKLSPGLGGGLSISAW